jgi:hypothetical protein
MSGNEREIGCEYYDRSGLFQFWGKSTEAAFEYR